MTATCTEPRQTRSSTQVRTERRPAVEDLLRDMAFAMRLARQAAQEIRTEAAAVERAVPADQAPVAVA